MKRNQRVRADRKTKWKARQLNLAIACLAALGMLAAGAGSASAELGYQYLCPGPQICSEAYSLPFGVGVDNSSGATSGDVYVANITNGKLYRFTATGAAAPFTGGNGNIEGNHLGGFGPGPVGPINVAVDSASGNFYVIDRKTTGNVVDKFDPTGEPLGSFELPPTITQAGGIAIDESGGPSNGDFWIGDGSTHVVYKFSPTGTKLAPEIHLPEGGEPYSVAVDSSGHVYVANDQGNVGGDVKKYDESGTFESTLDPNQAQAVAIDPSTGDIFVVDAGGTQIQPYTSAGAALTAFGSGTLGGFSVGIGVNASNHFVYVTNLNGNTTAMYGAGEAPPPPETKPATEVTGTTAKLHGVLNPNGATGELGYHFAYNTTPGSCEGGGTTAPGTVAEAKEAPVETEATGLTPTTEYTFCLVATNSFGPAPGNLLTFTTTAAAPSVTEETATEVTTVSAKASAMINPNGATTTCKVEYGLTEAYGSEIACSAALGEGIAPVPVSLTIPGLTANTPYHFRFVAENVEGITPGTDVEFKTKPLVECETGEANPVGSETAMLHGKVKTGEEAATYYFEYGETVAYGSSTEVKEIPAGAEGEHAVNIEAASLVPGTTYHYQIVCSPKSEPGLLLTGGDQVLATLPAKPVIKEEFCENENRHSLSLGAEINPKNSETTYVFEYGKTAAYGSQTSGGTILKGLTTVEAGPESVTELDPGTTYHFRVVATNGAGTVDGPDETCETTAPKPPGVKSESSAQVAQTTATVSGTVNPNGLQTSYILEVGTEVEPGHVAYTPSFGEVGSGTEDVELAFALSNLLPGTTYHYRLVAQNEDGTAFGADQTFLTGSFPPVITLPGPVQIIPTPPQPKEEKVKIVPHETRAEMYKKAVKLCKKKPKSKRATCMRRAKKQFGPVKKKGKKK